VSRKPSMSAAARTRAERRELRRLLAHAREVMERHTREMIAEGLLAPLPTQTAPGASSGPVLEGRFP
jgi:hypothetical protein